MENKDKLTLGTVIEEAIIIAVTNAKTKETTIIKQRNTQHIENDNELEEVCRFYTVKLSDLNKLTAVPLLERRHIMIESEMDANSVIGILKNTLTSKFYQISDILRDSETITIAYPGKNILGEDREISFISPKGKESDTPLGEFGITLHEKDMYLLTKGPLKVPVGLRNHIIIYSEKPSELKEFIEFLIS